jgi:hypothetical protein
MRTGQTQRRPRARYPEFNRTVWTLPLTFLAPQPRVLYFAHQHLYRTRIAASTGPLSGDLTREDPGTPATLDAPTAALTDRWARAVASSTPSASSPVADRHLWAGTDDGLIWRTRTRARTGRT